MAAVANVTARVCSRRNTAAAVEFLLTVECKTVRPP